MKSLALSDTWGGNTRATLRIKAKVASVEFVSKGGFPTKNS